MCNVVQFPEKSSRKLAITPEILREVLAENDAINAGEDRRAIARSRDNRKWFRENPSRQYRVVHIVDCLKPDLVSDWIILIYERGVARPKCFEIEDDKFGPVSNTDTYARRRLAYLEYKSATHDQRVEVEALFRRAA